ncbi:MAG: peroxiredoxin [Fibrobacterota bacterium]
MSLNLKAGDRAPDFSLNNKDGKPVRLSAFKGKWVVLYFYPKDDTPGCTQEAIDFTGMAARFKKENAVIIGISPDSEASHVEFTEKYNLKVELLSDPDHKVLETYGAWQEKNNYGNKSMGVVRSTCIIDDKGFVREAWEKVKVDGHADEVYGAVCSLRLKKD